MPDETLPLYLHLLHQAAAGRLEGLECPKCRHAAVSAWFTHPAEDFYRTWFLCAKCDFHTRAQNTEKPMFFSEERRRIDLETRDSAILQQSVFKRPTTLSTS
jgi:hypothetical protein